VAPDHPWVIEHPDFFVPGTEEQLAAQPQNYCRVETVGGTRVLAYGRGPDEAADAETSAFYDVLLECLKDPAFRDGDWDLLECRPAWDGNETSDAFVAFSWTGPGERRRLVAVNYARHASQCRVALPWRDLDGRGWRLQDLSGPAVYDRPGDGLTWPGLYLDMPAWDYHVFAVAPAESPEC
jgi:hypothetical protein